MNFRSFSSALFATVFLCSPSMALVADPLAVPGGWATGTTGGRGGAVDTATNATEFAAQLKKRGPHIIYVKGSIAGTFYLKQSNVSILGLPGAEIVGSFAAQGYGMDSITRNVIVRNLTVRPEGTCTGDEGEGSCETFGDAFTLKYIRKVWIDHVTIRDGLDGNLDITHGCDSITLSWIKQHYTRTGIAHQFANLIGHSDDNAAEDEGRLRITWHHSWWGTGIRERMPRVRFGKIHLYNNLFNSATANYCIRVAYKADILAESNAFVGTKSPVDLYDNKTFLHGVITMRNNLFKNTTIAAASDTSSTGVSFKPEYPYTPDSPASLESTITSATEGAGANLTWGKVSSIEAARNSAEPGFIRASNGMTTLVNPTAQGISAMVRSIDGRVLVPSVSIAPGAVLELPVAGRPRIVRIETNEGSFSRLLAR
ncbi:MAG: hypothetical protein IPK50_15540 [Fibrobacterota bacterium]|nr:hypothetical protein [Fibrobacterota bacterium]QQS03705.1 MAG: hypothetical protein IPK50_15540 [Fibrobacterota bacterium]